MIQFYSEEFPENTILPEGESLHCCRVLRHREGDEIFVTNGKGCRYRCIIRNANPKHTEVEICGVESEAKKKEWFMTLAVAPTKSADRMEWMVEKAVELGVGRIVLLKCDRSERKTFRVERLEKVAVSAMKQSLGVTLPEIEEFTSFGSFIESCRDIPQKFFGYCSEEFARKEFVREYKKGGEVVVMIGPEGDFTPEEVGKAIEAGFLPVTFGDERLRTETACIFAVTAVNVLNQL